MTRLPLVDEVAIGHWCLVIGHSLPQWIGRRSNPRLLVFSQALSRLSYRSVSSISSLKSEISDLRFEISKTKKGQPVCDGGPWVFLENETNSDRLSQAQGKLLPRKLRGGKRNAFVAGYHDHDFACSNGLCGFLRSPRPPR